MKTRYRFFQRNSGIFFVQDNVTGKQESLKTRDKAAARRIFNVKNEAFKQPAMNLQIAQVYLQHADSALAGRTWQHVMEQIICTKTGSTRTRWECAIKDKSFDSIHLRKLIETLSEHFLEVLKTGTVSTNGLFASDAQLRNGNALVALADFAATSLADGAIQGRKGGHLGGAPEDRQPRKQSGNARFLSIALAFGRLANGHRHPLPPNFCRCPDACFERSQ